MKDNRKTWIITTIICLLPVIAGIILYPSLPDEVVTHWGVNGEPNGWMNKFVGTIVLPGILVVVNLLIPAILKMDPKYENITPKAKALIMWIIPAVSILCSSATLGSALGFDTKIELIAPLFIGLLFTVIGNYMPKMKPSYTVGVKLPWTLASEENWIRTHRISGIVWVVCGLLVMVLSFVPGTAKMIVMFVLLALMIAVPVIYSYCLFKKGI